MTDYSTFKNNSLKTLIFFSILFFRFGWTLTKCSFLQVVALIKRITAFWINKFYVIENQRLALEKRSMTINKSCCQKAFIVLLYSLQWNESIMLGEGFLKYTVAVDYLKILNDWLFFTEYWNLNIIKGKLKAITNSKSRLLLLQIIIYACTTVVHLPTRFI